MLVDRGVYNELIFGAVLHVVASFKLTVFHMVLFHAHKGCVSVGFCKRVACAHVGKVTFVATHSRRKVVLDLFEGLFGFFVAGVFLKTGVEPAGNLIKVRSREVFWFRQAFGDSVLLVDSIDLVKQLADFCPQFLAVLLRCLFSGKRVPVGVCLDLGSI